MSFPSNSRSLTQQFVAAAQSAAANPRATLETYGANIGAGFRFVTNGALAAVGGIGNAPNEWISGLAFVASNYVGLGLSHQKYGFAGSMAIGIGGAGVLWGANALGGDPWSIVGLAGYTASALPTLGEPWWHHRAADRLAAWRANAPAITTRAQRAVTCLKELPLRCLAHPRTHFSYVNNAAMVPLAVKDILIDGKVYMAPFYVAWGVGNYIGGRSRAPRAQTKTAQPA